MNNYKLQYWMYACLNKEFGQEVKLHRDSLHSLYRVNRHGFEISTNTLNLNVVKKWFLNKIKRSSFSEKQEGSIQYFSKIVDNKEFVITLNEQSRGLDWKNSNKPVLLVNLYSYKK